MPGSPSGEEPKPPSTRITYQGYTFSEGELEWARQNLDQMRRTVRGNRLLYWMMAVTFILGMIAYLVSFAFTRQRIALPPGWLAEILPDFLYNLGIILWTSVILVFFLEVVVDVQRKRWRRYIQLIEQVSREQGMPIPAGPALAAGEEGLESRMEALVARLETLEKAWKNMAPAHPTHPPESSEPEE